MDPEQGLATASRETPLAVINLLSQGVLAAQIASAEQSGSIRILESALEPQVPVSSGLSFGLPLAGALGLFLGVGGRHVCTSPSGYPIPSIGELPYVAPCTGVGLAGFHVAG